MASGGYERLPSGRSAARGIAFRRKVSTQTEDLVFFTDEIDLSEVKWVRVSSGGYLLTRKTSAPADSVLATSEMGIWWKDTVGSAGLQIKGKDSAGTVVTQDLAAKRLIRFVVDGGGSVPSTGAKKAYFRSPFAGTIVKWSIIADVSGSAVFDIWKDTYANYPPTNADSITASAKPTLSSAIKAEGSTLTGWTTSIAEGDILEVEVESASTSTLLILDLWVRTT